MRPGLASVPGRIERAVMHSYPADRWSQELRPPRAAEHRVARRPHRHPRSAAVRSAEETVEGPAPPCLRRYKLHVGQLSWKLADSTQGCGLPDSGAATQPRCQQYEKTHETGTLHHWERSCSELHRGHMLVTSMKKSLLLCLGWAVSRSLQAGGGGAEGRFREQRLSLARESASWPDDLEWQGTAETNLIQLLDGRWELPDEDSVQRRFSGLVFDEVVYGDLQGDSREEGRRRSSFRIGRHDVSLLGYVSPRGRRQAEAPGVLPCGRPSARGLYRVYVQNRKLIVELYDPDKAQGDCCSSGFIREGYRWAGQSFVKTGTTGHGSPKSSSRRPVSTFGLPSDSRNEPD